MRLIAATQGVAPETIERYAGNVSATRPQKWVEPTQDELDRREMEEQRRMFAPTMARVKLSARRGNGYLILE